MNVCFEFKNIRKNALGKTAKNSCSAIAYAGSVVAGMAAFMLLKLLYFISELQTDNSVTGSSITSKH
jgi:hypothetical protein